MPVWRAQLMFEVKVYSTEEGRSTMEDSQISYNIIEQNLRNVGVPNRVFRLQ